MARKHEICRTTSETSVEVSLDLDGVGCAKISTGYDLLDHFLGVLALHSGFDMSIVIKSAPLNIHHVSEDAGLAFGAALKGALGGGNVGINRYGWAAVPFDEVLGLVSLDVSGRPGYFLSPADGLRYDDIAEFFRGFATGAEVTLHLQVINGGNLHHILEAFFKGLGLALRQAAAPGPYPDRAFSTKGMVQTKHGPASR